MHGQRMNNHCFFLANIIKD